MCERNSAAGRRRSTPMLPKRGSVVLLQEYVHCEAFFFLWGGDLGISVERRRREWGGGATLPMLPLATLIKTGCR